MNAEAKSGKPFFNHWMTVSNHRPFTYPEGKIDIPGNAKSREGGVKYTDYALKNFSKWLKNRIGIKIRSLWLLQTIVLPVQETELPMDKYRIPAMVFSEGFIQPQKFTQTMSQIDVMPTVLGLLNFSYQSKFLGQDVFSKEFQPKAYVATYQDLGFVKDNYLTVISPLRKIKQYALVQQKNNLAPEFNIYFDENPLKEKEQNKPMVDATISAYQSTSFWLKKIS
jgi:phosphoglycerol transferase MdoB-like AlkP superfamily enzyme